MIRSSRERLEFFFLAVISNRLRGRWPDFLRFTLKHLSRVYSLIMNIRLALYEHRILRSKTLGCQVISVGNLTVGGTGKTPVVEAFARALQQNGRQVAILSRGYKKVATPLSVKIKGLVTFDAPLQLPPRIVSDGRRLLLDSAYSGDEPYMLASNLPNVCVLVDKDRVKSGRYAIQKLNCDTLILDDGFQYLRLKHRVDIVLVDRTNPFDNGYTLPRGLLRESKRHLSRASFIFITKANHDGSPELRQQIRALNDKTEIAECRHAPRYVQDVFTGTHKPLEFIRGQNIVALSGIAAPRGFEDSLTKLGANIIYRKRFADHHRYTQQEILDIINASHDRRADAIFTTEKDAVRFPKIERRDVPIYFLRIEIELLSGEESFNELISRICFK